VAMHLMVQDTRRAVTTRPLSYPGFYKGKIVAQRFKVPTMDASQESKPLKPAVPPSQKIQPSPSDPRPATAAGTGYLGRFAPSPTGPLHAGSLVAALASCLDARAHSGRWLLRIEDLDQPRNLPGALQTILGQLRALGFEPDEEPVRQSKRHELYREAFDRLRHSGAIYPCTCSRKEIADSLALSGIPHQRNQELIYPGTCRHGLPGGQAGKKQAFAWRVRVGDASLNWQDRALGAMQEELATQVGDFVLLRADGVWAYQLAVVVDDALQKVTDVVRGEDLLGSTARQIFLQQMLGCPHPRYLHFPLVLGPQGEKLSKQTGAQALRTDQPVLELNRALSHLGLEAIRTESLREFWDEAPRRWAASRWMRQA
ncbi:MAG: tRNA glutamyl-Q(34) synthetase GluQRS, partial [Quisquiliibacterium sp.]